MKKVSTLVGIIIIVAITTILFGGLFAYQYFATKQLQLAKKSLQTQQILNKPFPLAGESTTQTAGWKTYTNDEIKLSFEYPSTWQLDTDPVNGDAIKGIILRGDEGTIQLDYGQGVVAICNENIEKIQIGNKQFDGCHLVDEGSPEYWYMKDPSNFGFRIFATAKNPYLSNRGIILNILSTFRFIP